MKKGILSLACITALLTATVIAPQASLASSEAAAGPSGDYLELKTVIPEDATGAHAYYNYAFTVNGNFVFKKGDMLEYDVKLSEAAGGFGGIDLAIGATPNMREDGKCKDQHEIPAHPSNNISEYAGKGEWYSRKIPVTEAFVEQDYSDVGAGPAVILAADIADIAPLAGKTVTVQYDNIRITRNGETVELIFAGRENALPTEPVYYLDLKGNEKVTTTLQIVEVDPEPDETEPDTDLTEPDVTEPDVTEPTKPVYPREETDKGAVGDYLELKMVVSASANGSIQYYNQAFTVSEDFTFQEGDILMYDVKLLNELGGLGAVDMFAGDNVTLRDDENCVDQHNVRDHPTANIAGLAFNQWYSREVKLGSAFIAASAEGPAKVLIAAEIPAASSVVGQTITVQYDNIRIVRGGKTVEVIFADRNDALPSEPIYYLDLSGNPGVETTLRIVESGKSVNTGVEDAWWVVIPAIFAAAVIAAVVVMDHKQRKTAN